MMTSLLLALIMCSRSAADAINEGLESLSTRFAALPFHATMQPPPHQANISVGVFLEHLYSIDEKKHSFQADFWLVYRWIDPRNYTGMFFNNRTGELFDAVEVEEISCSTADVLTSHRRLAASSPAPRRYLELGHDAIGALWRPDLHIRNLHKGVPKLHSELIRLYEDGTVEQLQLVYADLELLHPYYAPYPFDHQSLTVEVESLAHTTLQLTVAPLHLFSGLNAKL